MLYVDHDPLVLVHARSLLTSTPEGATAYLEADLREPDRILGALPPTLDPENPIALLLMSMLHFLSGSTPYDLVRRLTGKLAPGSYLVVSHATGDHFPPELAADFHSGRYGIGALRTRAEVAAFFDGLELVEPGVTDLAEWRPEPEHAGVAEVAMYAGVARIP